MVFAVRTLSCSQFSHLLFLANDKETVAVRGTWRVLTLNLEVATTLALRFRRALSQRGLAHRCEASPTSQKERKTKTKVRVPAGTEKRCLS